MGQMILDGLKAMVLGMGMVYTFLVIMILLMIFCIIPLILMLTVSLSSEASLVRGYRFIPDEWSLDAYAFMWAKRTTIFRAYGLTIIVTVIGAAKHKDQNDRAQ